MNINIKNGGKWYHGSNLNIDVLRPGSTITHWKELAEAFAHKPTLLSYDENGEITHNGKETGYLYKIDENLIIGKDIYQHPRTTMDVNVEFLTKRLLKLQLIFILPVEEDRHNMCL